MAYRSSSEELWYPRTVAVASAQYSCHERPVRDEKRAGPPSGRSYPGLGALGARSDRPAERSPRAAACADSRCCAPTAPRSEKRRRPGSFRWSRFARSRSVADDADEPAPPPWGDALLLPDNGGDGGGDGDGGGEGSPPTPRLLPAARDASPAAAGAPTAAAAVPAP
jgi:hypothetical protein